MDLRRTLIGAVRRVAQKSSEEHRVDAREDLVEERSRRAWRGTAGRAPWRFKRPFETTSGGRRLCCSWW